MAPGVGVDGTVVVGQSDLDRLLREFEGSIHRKWQINVWEGLGEGVREYAQFIWPEQLGGGKALAERRTWTCGRSRAGG